MDNKKRAAAMAGVYAHIKTGEEAYARHMAEQAENVDSEGSVVTVLPGPAPNIWGMTGRQSLMQANTMMQLRMFS
ncbi:MAG: hypothetical protein ABR534_08065 [Desulfotignum sp.]